jgi:hypothetical protein
VGNVVTWKNREMHIKFWSENFKERDLEAIDTERKILKWILQKQCEMVWTGFIWLRKGISGGLL